MLLVPRITRSGAEIGQHMEWWGFRRKLRDRPREPAIDESELLCTSPRPLNLTLLPVRSSRVTSVEKREKKDRMC